MAYRTPSELRALTAVVRVNSTFHGITKGQIADLLDDIADSPNIPVTLPSAVGGTANVSSAGASSGPSFICGVYDFLPSGTSDDWARLNALIALGWRKFQFHEGTYYCTTPGALVSDVEITLDPNTEIRATIPEGNGVEDSCFFAGQTAEITTTLSSAAAVGDSQVIVVAPSDLTYLGVGGYLVVGNSALILATSLHQITAVSGSGPYTITLDRPLLRARLNGSQIRLMKTCNRNIHIRGNKAKLRGTVGRWVELFVGWDCHVTDLVIDNTLGTARGVVCSLDVPAYRCTIERSEISYNNEVDLQPGFYCESAEDSALIGNKTKGCYYGQILADCTNSRIVDPECVGGIWSTALIAGNSGYATESCIDCIIQGGIVSGSHMGAFIRDGSHGCLVDNLKAIGCWYLVAINTNTPRNNTIQNCQSVGSLAIGINALGATGTVVKNHKSTDDVVGLACDADMAIDGLSFSGTNRKAVDLTGYANARVTLKNADITNTSGAMLAATAGAKITASDSTFRGHASASRLADVGGTSSVSIQNSQATGFGSGTAIAQLTSGGSYADLGGNDFSSAGTPIATALIGSTTITQTGGVAAKTVTTADVTTTLAECYCTRVAVTGALTGNRSLILKHPFAGATYTVSNATTEAFSVTFKGTSGDTGVAVAQGKSAMLQVDSTGAIVRLTADI